MANTWYLSFGNLRVGENFKFSNPYVAKENDNDDEVFVKVSPRKYRSIKEPLTGRAWQTGVRACVVVVRIER